MTDQALDDPLTTTDSTNLRDKIKLLESFDVLDNPQAGSKASGQPVHDSKKPKIRGKKIVKEKKEKKNKRQKVGAKKGEGNNAASDLQREANRQE